MSQSDNEWEAVEVAPADEWEAVPEPEQPSDLGRVAKGAGMGGLKGLLLGLPDEIQGVGGGLAALLGGRDFSEGYTQQRDSYRAEEKAAQAAAPTAFGASELGGSVASMFIPGLSVAKGAKLGATAGKAALAGGISGAGYSDADTVGGVAADAALGGAFGGAAGGAGYGLGKVLGGAGAKAGDKLAQAEAKIAEQAASKVDDVVNSARSKAGSAGSDLVRGLDIVRDPTRQAAALADDIAKVEALKGRIAGADQRLFHNAAEGLTSKIDKADDLIGKYHDVLGAKPELVKEAAGEIGRSSIGADAKSLFKSYGEPLVAMYAGEQIGDALGVDGMGGAAGLLFGRTRMGRAIGNRLAKPGNQKAFYGGLQKMLDVSPGRLGAEAGVAQRNYMSAFPRLSQSLGLAPEEEDEALAQR